MFVGMDSEEQNNRRRHESGRGRREAERRRTESGREQTKSRHTEEPRSSRIKINYPRGREYHKRSTYGARDSDQISDPSPIRFAPANHRSPSYEEAHRPDPAETSESEEESTSESEAESTHLYSKDSEDGNERSVPLSSGFSFGFFDPNGKSQEPFPQGSPMNLDRARMMGSKDKSKSYTESMINVSSSRYVIDSSEPRKLRKAELVSQPPAGEQEGTLLPLLNWIHLEGKTPTLESFMKYVANLTGLTDEEQDKAQKLLNPVQNRYEKQFRTFAGSQASYVEPVCLSAGGGHDRKDKPPVILLCLPYFELAPLLRKSPTQSSGVHQLRTLLQYSNAHAPTSNSKDLQQAICHLDSSRDAHCFHVSSLWCLFIANDILITCTNRSPSDMQQNAITRKTPSDPQNAYEPKIHVSYGENRVFLLAVKECTTWLEFVAHFRPLSTDFQNDFEVLFEGAVKDPEDWSSMIRREHADKKTIYLSLRPKSTQRRRLGRWVRPSTSTSNDASNSSTGGAEHNHSAQSTRKASTPAVVSGVQTNKKQDTRHHLENVDAGQHETRGTNPPEPDCDGIQTASINDAHIFLRAYVVQKPEVPTEGMEEASNVADSATTFQYDTKKLQEKFEAMDKRLRSKNFSKFSHEYENCPTRTLQQAETRSSQILKEGQESSKRAESRSEPREIINPRAPKENHGNSGTKHLPGQRHHPNSDIAGIDAPIKHSRRQRKFLQNAKTLCTFFIPLVVPLKSTPVLVAKYWGAVYVLIEDHHKFTKSPYNRDSLVADILETLGTLASELTQEKAPPPWRMKIPEILGEAWLSLIMSLVLSLDDDDYDDQAFLEFKNITTAVSRGREEILKSLARQPLQKLEAVIPLGIASLVFDNLINRGVPGQPDIASTYSEYLHRLEHDSEANPYDRGHQEKLTRFRDEVACIQKVQHDQLERMKELKHLAWPSKKTGYRRKGYAFMILHHCILSTRERKSSFEGMNTRAIKLGRYNIQRIEANKDRQEAAIFVFTAVTIIFLPLSFISSLFGMNTYEIRNMNSRQWVFWATAIPVTFIVIGLAIVAVLNVDSVRAVWARIVERDGRQRAGKEEPGQVVDGDMVAPPLPLGSPRV